MDYDTQRQSLNRAEHFATFETVGTFPGKREGHTRDIVFGPCG